MATLAEIEAAFQSGRDHEMRSARAAVEWWSDEQEAAGHELALAEACRALELARAGDVEQALHHARRACELEVEEYGECLAWRPLHQALCAACAAKGIAVDPSAGHR